MVTTLPAFRATSRDTTSKFHARFYGINSNRPVTKAIHTQVNSHGRAPRLDLIMEGNQLQPYIHNSIVEINHRQRTTRFHVFVKNHRRLPLNGMIERWTNMPWKGDIVVMRKGISRELVNICAKDASLADFAVKNESGRSVVSIFPRTLYFTSNFEVEEKRLVTKKGLVRRLQNMAYTNKIAALPILFTKVAPPEYAMNYSPSPTTGDHSYIKIQPNLTPCEYAIRTMSADFNNWSCTDRLSKYFVLYHTLYYTTVVAFSGISNYRADYELSTDAYNDERTRTSDCSVLNQDKHLSSLPPRYEAESFTDADSPSRHIQLSIMNYPPMSTMTKERGTHYLGTNIISGEEVTIKLESVKAKHPKLEYESKLQLQYNDCCSSDQLLTNFGAANRMENRFAQVIQPRALRAPEVIIGADWDTKANIWNLGCLLYEFARGAPLFNPFWKNEESGMKPAEAHLAQITGLFGQFPFEFMRKGTESNWYFDDKGHLLKGAGRYVMTLEALLSRARHLPQEIQEVANLSQMLVIDPTKRLSAGQLLEHPWLQNVN
ncbi:kinase-like protein [Phlegmacium glaucopus]|nr:kinase-like protein [Phlegmacium glaucopus]